jgi:hypothetical protein
VPLCCREGEDGVVFRIQTIRIITGLIISHEKSYGIMPELIKRKCKNPDAYLDEEDLKAIAESEEDFRQGRFYTHEEVKKRLGFR